ncbi:hypothetical protein JCM5350_003436 [Sporobolomyces pararoseus]
MTLSEPSDQPSFERATRIGSTQIRLTRTTMTQSFASASSRSKISPLNSSVVPSNGSHSRPSNQGPLPTLRPSYLSDHQYTTPLPASSPSNPRKRYSGEMFNASPASKRRLPPYFARETPSVERRVDLLVSIESVGEGIRLFRRMRKRQDEFDLEWEKLIEEKNE